jgi:DNA-binding beta-propeller fold protein YncE
MRRKRRGIALAATVTCALLFAGHSLLRRSGLQPVLYTVSLPPGAYGVALDTRTRRAFISGASVTTGTGSVWVYDLPTGHLLRTLGPFPPSVEVTVIAVFQRAFVTDGSGLVTILDARSGRILGTTAAGGDPTAIAVDARHGWLALTNPNSDSIDVLDARTGREVRRIYLSPSAEPSGIWVDDRTQRVISVNAGTHTISVVDAARGVVVHTVPVGGYPWVAVDGRHGHVLVPTRHGLLVLASATGRILRTIPVPTHPDAITVDERTGHAFLTSAQIVTMVDTRTGRQLRTIPGRGVVVGIDDRRDRIYVWSAGALRVLDGQSGALIRTEGQGLSPAVVAISPFHHRVLVASTDPVGNTGAPVTAHLIAADGTVLWSQGVGVAPVALTVDDQAHYAIILTAGEAMARTDPGQWLPRWMRDLPFLPVPLHMPAEIPAQMIVLDLAR